MSAVIAMDFDWGAVWDVVWVLESDLCGEVVVADGADGANGLWLSGHAFSLFDVDEVGCG